MMLTAKHKTFSLALFLALVALLSLGLMLSVAQQAGAGGLWSAWLFTPGGPNADQPRLVRVYENGAVNTWSPPLAEGEFLMGPIQAFNDSGEWAAYCVRGTDGHLRLEVHNLFPESRLREGYSLSFPIVVDLGEAVACQVDAAAFNSANPSLLAFSVVHHWPGEPDAATSLPAWELHVLDLAQGTLTRTLAPDSTALAEWLQPDLAYLPAVRQHRGDDLIFALEPFGAGGWFEAQAFLWSAAGLTPVEGFNTANYATVAGSPQRAWLALDTARLSADGTGSPFHTLVYRDNAGNSYPIFEQPAGLVQPAFVNHAQQIAVSVPGYGVVAVNRDGSILGLPVGQLAGPLLPAPGGYGFLEVDAAASETRFVIHHITPDASAINATVVWQDQTPGWTSVWSAPVGALPDLPPFTPLAGE